MKQKYLLGMLLGGALLTACSMDDDLNPANVAQDVNPSAPVFTVSFDNGGNALTRATFNNGQMTFQDADDATGRKADLLSLYHGIENADFSKAYQNAIYAPRESGTAEGKLEWATNSMVLGGTAVMMYPADTKGAKFPGWKSAPIASIGAEQDSTSMTKLPYASAGLNIIVDDTKDKDVAGYAKEYDIRMKPLASIVRLGLNENLAELQEKLAGIVDEFEITNVALKSTNGGVANKIFTTGAPITLTSVAAPTAHKTWTYKVGVDVSGTEKSDKISTEWIPAEEGKLVANLPLLPFVQTGTPTLGDLELAVETTFGTVYITSKNEKGEVNKVVSHPYFKDNASIGASATEAVQKKLKDFIEKAKRTDKLTLNEAFEKIVEPVVDDQTLGSASFPGEYAGQSIQLAVDVDLRNVDLTEMHLKDSKELITAIKVYNALEKTYDAKFYLDGGKEVANTFVMTDEALGYVMERLAVKDNKIKFIPCAKDKGMKIRLKNEGQTAIDIPDLLLTMDKGVESVPVELAGAWNLKSDKDATKAIKLMNIESLTVLENATLNLTGYIQTANIPEKDGNPAVVGGLKGTKDNNNGIIVKKGGAVNVLNGRVVLKVNMENSGDIYVGGDKEETTNTEAELYVGGDVKLTNNAAEVNKNKHWADYWKESGNIWNHGSLGVLSEENEKAPGEVNNYGVITVKSGNATTYVTRNAEVEAKEDGGAANVTVEFSEKNRVGSIVLFDVTGSGNNTKVGNKRAQGFIKYTIESGAVNETTVGSVANYIIVKGAIDGDIKTITGGKNSKVKYIEFDGVNNKNILTNTFDAIVINKNSKLTVPENETLTLTGAGLYLKGTLRFSGILENNYWGLYKTIFGNSAEDENVEDDNEGSLVNTGEGQKNVPSTGDSDNNAKN